METIHIPSIGLTFSFFLIRGCCLAAVVFMYLKLHLLLLRQRNSLPTYILWQTFCCYFAAKEQPKGSERFASCCRCQGNPGQRWVLKPADFSSKFIINGMDDLGSQSFLELNLTHESSVNYIDGHEHGILQHDSHIINFSSPRRIINQWLTILWKGLLLGSLPEKSKAPTNSIGKLLK